MIRLLHTADLHLGSVFPGLGEAGAGREEDFLKTFKRIIDQAIACDVQLLLVAGDLFDHPRPEKMLLATVQGELQRLVQRGIIPVLLPGTHDHHLGGEELYTRQNFSGAVLLTEPHIDAPTLVKVADQDVYLYGLAYLGGQSSAPLADMKRRGEGGIHLGLLHGSLEGSPDWEYRSKDLPFTLAGLKQWDLDYVALGHYHRFQELQDVSRCWACYPGSPEGKRFGENGPRYAALVEVGERQARVEAIEVQSRVLLEAEMELEAGMSDAAIVAAICKLGDEQSLVRLRLCGVLDRALDREWLLARCQFAFAFLDLLDETRWLQGDFVAGLAAEETIRGECVRRFQELLQQTSDAQGRDEIEQAFREVMVRFQSPGPP